MWFASKRYWLEIAVDQSDSSKELSQSQNELMSLETLVVWNLPCIDRKPSWPWQYIDLHKILLYLEFRNPEFSRPFPFLPFYGFHKKSQSVIQSEGVICSNQPLKRKLQEYHFSFYNDIRDLEVMTFSSRHRMGKIHYCHRMDRLGWLLHLAVDLADRQHEQDILQLLDWKFDLPSSCIYDGNFYLVWILVPIVLEFRYGCVYGMAYLEVGFGSQTEPKSVQNHTGSNFIIFIIACDWCLARNVDSMEIVLFNTISIQSNNIKFVCSFFRLLN